MQFRANNLDGIESWYESNCIVSAKRHRRGWSVLVHEAGNEFTINVSSREMNRVLAECNDVRRWAQVIRRGAGLMPVPKPVNPLILWLRSGNQARH